VAATKRYDRAYFDRWYRDPRRRIDAPGELRRRVAMAVAITERFLGRPVRNVLDVGCGEGRWRAELRRLRPRVDYLGVEPSEYAVERFGARRNLIRGGFGELPDLDLGGPFDLVVCADVLHYVDDAELASGLPELAAAVGGAAYLEVLAAEDPVEGDRRALRMRSAATYRAALRRVGLAPVGCHVWLCRELAERAAELESGRTR
jgi:SAM-dependent methyltransferase